MPDTVSYLDFVRLGAALAGKMGSQKDAVVNLAIQRGVVENMSELSSDEFADIRDSAKQIFA